MTAPLLLHLPYSPWSERARWALDVRGVPYRLETYRPLLGERRLARLRQGATGPLTVPVLVTHESEVLTESLDIARFADRHGGVGPTLFPEGADEAVARWNAVANRALEAGRGLALRRTLAMSDALDELVPRTLRPLGPVARALAAYGVRRALRKYEVDGGGETELRDRLSSALDELRAGLDAAPASAGAAPRTLLGALSYADLTAAQALAFVRPASAGVRIGRANRAAFTDPALAERHADLLAWRDGLYAAYR